LVCRTITYSTIKPVLVTNPPGGENKKREKREKKKTAAGAGSGGHRSTPSSRRKVLNLEHDSKFVLKRISTSTIDVLN
jgi:hypothetical protein